MNATRLGSSAHPRQCLLISLLVTGVVSVHVRASADAQAPVAETQAEGVPLPPEPPPGYRDTINAAVAEFAAGHHAEARALFRQAHGAYPNARTLRGIGMCAFELREYAEAVRALGASLTDTRRPLTAEQVTQVQSALERANAFVGRFEVTVPEGALLFVDDSAAPAPIEGDGTLLLTLGTHVVATRQGSTTLGEVRVEVRGGEREPLVLVRTEAPRSPPRVEPDLHVQPVEEAPPEPLTVPGIALVASGGAALVAGFVLVGLGVADASSVTGAAQGTRWSSLAEAYDRAPILEGVGAAALGVGAALATIGVVLLVSPTQPVPRTTVRLGPTGLSLRGSF
ncbi:MAG: hypothetical protein K1X94_22830 [Sandaracinaceae bacterium]|nr:hypothetical protein [Sandaracinaceae bacterium]